MKTTRFLVLALITILSFPLFLNAQQPAPSATAVAVVPRLVSFSGTVVNAQGKPLTGIAGVTFTIYKGQYDGAPLWMETQNVQADSKGNYIAQLGAARADGLPVELFATGEARWLGVRVNGGEEQPRVMLLSVPYALKAGDAATIGGLPPSAFMLAGSPRSGAPETAFDTETSNPALTTPPPASTVTTGGGTVNALPLWTTATNLQSSTITQTGSGATAKIGIGTTSPTTALDVHGGSVIRGTFLLPAMGAATASAGKASQPEDLVASSFSSATSTPVNQTFQWQATPANNNTPNPGATLNLLYGLGATAPAQTGLRIGPKGIIGFAPGQTFPGMAKGTVTSVAVSAPASDFNVTGAPITNSGTLNLSWNVAPTSANTPNAIVKRDGYGDFNAALIRAEILSATSLGVNSPVSGSIAISADAGTTDTNQSVAIFGRVADSGIGVSGFSSGGGWGILGESNGQDGVHGVSHSTASGVAGINTDPRGTGVYGSAPGWAFTSNGNTFQDRTSGGWVKAMVFFSGVTGGIVTCFNSTLAGTAATTAPCGFALDKTGTGDYIVDFGFEVDDRFYSATGTGRAAIVSVCSNFVGGCNNSLTQNQVEVVSFSAALNYIDTKAYLIVY